MATPFNQGPPTVPVVLNTSNCFVFGNTASGNALSVQQLGAGNCMSVSNANGTVGLFVSSLGRVGVGTTNPGTQLQIGTGTGTPGTTPAATIFNGNLCTSQFGSVNFILNDSTDVNVTKYLTFAITGSAGYQCSIDIVIDSFGYGDVVDRGVFRFTVDASSRSDGSGAGATISPISVIGGGASTLAIVGATVSASTSQVRISFLRTTSLYAPWNYNAIYTFRGINGVACTGVSFA